LIWECSCRSGQSDVGIPQAKRQWAKYKKQNGADVPTGDQCAVCRDYLWDVMPAFDSWQDMTAMDGPSQKADEKRKDVAEGLAVKLGADERSFHPSEVATRLASGYTVSRKCNALNSAEVRSLLGGREPKGLLVKGLPSMKVPSAAKPSEKEKVWLFQWDSASAFRTVEFFDTFDTTQTTLRMPAEKHYFARQGTRCIDKLREELFENSVED